MNNPADPAPSRGALSALGVAQEDEMPRLTMLSGGVSCNVWKVEAARGAFVVKQALPQLRVAADWHASVERAENEVRWLEAAGAIAPELVPEVVGAIPAQHMLALRFVDDAPVWKDELITGRIDAGFAMAVGGALASIHAATAGDAIIAARFRTGDLFEQLRIDPFLRFVAAQHPQVRARLTELADALAMRTIALVHGDVSPKNILVARGGPVFLDAECAVYGDPAFDIAFCTAHLLLKSLWLPQHGVILRDAAVALVDGWRAGVDWEPVAEASSRAGALVPALLLARIEGKSPAPYLTDPQLRATIRSRAITMLLAEADPIDRLVADWTCA